LKFNTNRKIIASLKYQYIHFMKRYYQVDHKFLFFFGFIFYLFTPYFVGTMHFFQGFPGIDLYQNSFKKIPESKLIAYAEITLLWLAAFYLGHLSFKLLKPYKRTLQKFPSNATTQGIVYVSILLFLTLILFAFISRNSLLGGYSGSYDVGARGKMSTLLVVFNFFLTYQLVSKQKISWLLITGTIITAILLLTMGGRMYVMQTFLIFLIYKTSFARRRFKIYQVAGFLGVIFIIISFVGIWRMNTSFNPEMAAYSFFAEPVFTWFSTSSYLTSNDIPLFNIPLNFLTSFFNLIPNTFFNFQPYIVSTYQMAENYESPLGADSIWPNIIINFGSIGSLFFLYITGFLLNFLRHNSETSRFGAVYYIMVCSMLPFQFFRDGFYLLNKQLFFNFLILPVTILIVLKCVQYIPKQLFIQKSYSQT
jgi:O-antigen polysaccharide polymerase Wzy